MPQPTSRTAIRFQLTQIYQERRKRGAMLVEAAANYVGRPQALGGVRGWRRPTATSKVSMGQ